MEDAGGGMRGAGDFLGEVDIMAERSKIRNYRDLSVWQLGMQITVQVYQVTKSLLTQPRQTPGIRGFGQVVILSS